VHVPDQKDKEEEIMRIDEMFTFRVNVYPMHGSVFFQKFLSDSTARRRRHSLAA